MIAALLFSLPTYPLASEVEDLEELLDAVTVDTPVAELRTGDGGRRIAGK